MEILERGESFYQDTCRTWKVMFGAGAPVPLTVVNSDGGFTYDTSNMATLRKSVNEEQ